MVDQAIVGAAPAAPTEEATLHWLHQRLTALANLALMLWLIVSLALLPGYDKLTLVTWLAQPKAAIPMILLIVSTFYHARLGLQVIAEDYEKGEARVVTAVVLNFATILLATVAIFSILKVAFTGA